MESLHKKNLKEENYNFIKSSNENVENTFKPNSNTTIFQIIIWLTITIVVVVLLNKFFITE